MSISGLPEEPGEKGMPTTLPDVDDDRIQERKARRERQLAEMLEIDLSPDAAAQGVAFMDGWVDRCSRLHFDPIMGPLLEQASARYAELRVHGFEFAAKVARIEALRSIFKQAPSSAEAIPVADAAQNRAADPIGPVDTRKLNDGASALQPVLADEGMAALLARRDAMLHAGEGRSNALSLDGMMARISAEVTAAALERKGGSGG